MYLVHEMRCNTNIRCPNIRIDSRCMYDRMLNEKSLNAAAFSFIWLLFTFIYRWSSHWHSKFECNSMQTAPHRLFTKMLFSKRRPFIAFMVCRQCIWDFDLEFSSRMHSNSSSIDWCGMRKGQQHIDMDKRMSKVSYLAKPILIHIHIRAKIYAM